MLDALSEQSPIGLHLLGTALRVVRVNTGTPAMQGVAADELAGRPACKVYRMVDADVEALLSSST